jgi:hypothetical protein
MLIVFRVGGNETFDELHGPFVERAGGVPLVIAFDSPIGGIGSVAGDSSELQSTRVYPSAMMVAIGEINRAIGHEIIEIRCGGGAPGKSSELPPPAENPRRIGVLCGVGADDGAIFRTGGRTGEITAHSLQSTLDGVNVHVDKTRSDEAPGDIVNGGGFCALREKFVTPDGHNFAAGNPHRGELRLVASAIENAPVAKEEF